MSVLSQSLAALAVALLGLTVHGQIVTPDGCYSIASPLGFGFGYAPYSVQTAATQQDCLNLCSADARCVAARFGASALQAAGNCRLYNAGGGAGSTGTGNFIRVRPSGSGFGGFGGGGGGFIPVRRGNGGGATGGTGAGGFIPVRRGNGATGGANGGFIPVRRQSSSPGANARTSSSSQNQSPTSASDGTQKAPERGAPLDPKALADQEKYKEILRKASQKQAPTSTKARHFGRGFGNGFGNGFGGNGFGGNGFGGNGFGGNGFGNGFVGNGFGNGFVGNGFQRSGMMYRWTGRCARPGSGGGTGTGGGTTSVTGPPLVVTTAPVVTIPPVVTTVPARVFPEGTQCPAGQVAKFTRIPNTAISGTPTHSFNAGSPEACIAACNGEVLSDGTFAPCVSFNYDAASGTCALYLSAAQPAGTGTTAPAQGADYYEKVCLAENLVANCNDVLDVIPNALLVGFARDVATVGSQAECIEQCLNSQTLYGFKCVSGQYFAGVSSENCVLNEESKNTQPNLMQQVDEPGLTYFDFQCANLQKDPLNASVRAAARQTKLFPQGTDEWGAWTHCGPDGKKKRFRSCKSHRPSSCEKETGAC